MLEISRSMLAVRGQRCWPAQGHLFRRPCQWMTAMVCCSAVLIVIAVNAGAADPPSPAPPPDPAQRPVITRATTVAEVNHVTITYGDLESALFERVPNVTGHGTISPERLRQRAFEILDDLIRDELIVQEAKKLRITTDKKKVDAEMARQRGLFPSDDKFQDALRQRGLTLERFRQRIERAFVIQEVLNREVNQKVTVTDEEMAAYFRQHPEKFIMPEQHRLRLLFLSVDAAALPAEWERTRQRAAELRARAVRGEDFGALVRQSSDDPETRDRGGDTGLIHHGQLGVVEIERAVETLKPGELTEPIRTIYGVYLARVEEKRPGRQQTFEEVNKELFRQELLEAGRRQRHQEWIRGLIAQAKVTRLPAPAPAP